MRRSDTEKLYIHSFSPETCVAVVLAFGKQSLMMTTTIFDPTTSIHINTSHTAHRLNSKFLSTNIIFSARIQSRLHSHFSPRRYISIIIIINRGHYLHCEYQMMWHIFFATFHLNSMCERCVRQAYRQPAAAPHEMRAE